MKEIYSAPNQDSAKVALNQIENNWGVKYGYAIKSWRDNWEEFTAFLAFPLEIRKIVYTINIMEKSENIPKTNYHILLMKLS